MSISINTNIGALGASAASSAINKSMETSMERLSTGKRINAAKDDAAGVAIASRLTSEIRGTNQAIRNASDAQALIDTAEGAHDEVVNLLQRMRELSVQAANDTNNADDRTNIQAEMTALSSEIDRIASTTTWAGKNLLDHLGGSSGNAGARAFSFQIGARTNAGVDDISASINGISSTRLSVQSSSSAYTTTIALTSGYTAASGVAQTPTPSTLTVTSSSGAHTFARTAADDGTFGSGTLLLTITDANTGTALNTKTLSVSATTTDSAADLARKAAEAFNKKVLTTSTSPNAHDAAFIGFTATVNGAVMTIKQGISVTDAYAARGAINAIDNALGTVNTQRASLGAISNRLDSTVSNLTNIATNLQAGLGRIQDADFAAETTNLAKSQILQQASMAMLAQANASKQGVLSLLQR